MENRIMAVEVVCGPLEYTSLFHSSDIIAGGGNYMIQVLKLAIEQLSNNLRELGFILPKELLLQFDNSGENKNRDMLSYISLLVELLVFDSVEVNFLIVGHTHCSIDRLFGIYSNAIRGADFIGSPLALRALLDQACPDRKHYQKYFLSTTGGHFSNHMLITILNITQYLINLGSLKFIQSVCFSISYTVLIRRGFLCYR